MLLLYLWDHRRCLPVSVPGYSSPERGRHRAPGGGRADDGVLIAVDTVV
ncbi:hypothetical protein A2U01_0105204 [Trifolium medium]|uniref:Uncharacterized protein n=1 Tax=Trifolium medium TaxID=97028 RepID=A0A392V6H1_9FABA|nr:hypothetical protein [Trifolium medium]